MQDYLKPTVFGWHNVRCPDFIEQEEMNHPPDARRYEAGSFNITGYCGMKASMELLLEVGTENIATELLRKRNILIPQLEELGWTVLNADAPRTASERHHLIPTGRVRHDRPARAPPHPRD